MNTHMGLDAFVYCDCYEKGLLNKLPESTWNIYIDEDGCREIKCEDIDVCMEFDRWSAVEACNHVDGILVHHRLGNIALINRLREILLPYQLVLPIIWHKIVFSGTHSGDYLTVEQVQKLSTELSKLKDIHSDENKNEDFLRDFERQLSELVKNSLEVNKPIAF